LFTLTVNARSIAYLTSFDVTSRLTGGVYLTPSLIFTVTVLPSSEMSGIPAARSGIGSFLSGGYA
jgi:hypothetical protein